jgi:hypothetical protein
MMMRRYLNVWVVAAAAMLMFGDRCYLLLVVLEKISWILIYDRFVESPRKKERKTLKDSLFVFIPFSVSCTCT